MEPNKSPQPIAQGYQQQEQRPFFRRMQPLLQRVQGSLSGIWNTIIVNKRNTITGIVLLGGLVITLVVFRNNQDQRSRADVSTEAFTISPQDTGNQDTFVQHEKDNIYHTNTLDVKIEMKDIQKLLE